MFSAGFAESGVTDMDAPYPSTRSPSIDLHDYASDSDLDDEDDYGGEVPALREPASDNGAKQEKVETKVRLLSIVKCSNSDDRVQDGRMDNANQGNSSSPASTQEQPTVTSIAKPGRVVFLDDIAHLTFEHCLLPFARHVD